MGQSFLEVCDRLDLAEGMLPQIPFLGRGNIWIANNYDGCDMVLARHIIWKTVMETAPGQLSVIGYDKDLSGLFAPFVALSEGEYKTLELVRDDADLEKHLDVLRMQVQAVQNVIKGDGSLLEFREKYGRATEAYRLVVLYMDMGWLKTASLEIWSKICLLMRRGPAAGISFLIISYYDYEEVPLMAPNTTILDSRMENGINFVGIFGGQYMSYLPVDTDIMVEESRAWKLRVKDAKIPDVKMWEILEGLPEIQGNPDKSGIWQESSAEGLTFPIGLYGTEVMEITLGDEVEQKHNAVITGAVGQGKSNLISVIIHSLCQRYSPWEMEMYLLDYKEGVTFMPFSNIGNEVYLPHARALGLESDVSFGIAVLEELFAEYKRRMQLLKDNGMRSIREYRLRQSGERMPRIVVIIDEFHLMFGDNQDTGERVADMLVKAVRLFRAAGIHFILASQSLKGGLSLFANLDTLFSQIPIRIAMKNSIAESHEILGINNPAATSLRRGEAIVNADYGDVTQNRKTTVAWADEAALSGLRKAWWEMASGQFAPPYVFEGEKRIPFRDDMETVENIVRQSPAPIVVMGVQISLDGRRIQIPMADEPGRNIAIVGTPDRNRNHAEGMLQAAVVSLALWYTYNGRMAHFLCCDFSRPEEESKPWTERIKGFVEGSGQDMEIIKPEEFENRIESLSDEKSVEPVYVIGSMMDRWQYEEQESYMDPKLKKIVNNGPANGVHFIGWWVKSSFFMDQVVGIGGKTDSFNTKIFLRTDEAAVQSLTGSLIRWSPQENRALAWDDVEYDRETPFIPYASMMPEETVDLLEKAGKR